MAAAGLLLLLACTSAKPKAQTPGATVPTEAPTTTTTNPYAVPAVIDAAWINRVLAGLDAANGDVVRAAIANRTLSVDLLDRLRSLYADPDQFQLALDVLQDANRGGFANYLANPGNVLTTVVDIISTAQSCVYIKVKRDYSLVTKTTSATASTQWIAIKALDATLPASRLNPIGWTYIYEGFTRNLQAPTVNPCSHAS